MWRSCQRYSVCIIRTRSQFRSLVSLHFSNRPKLRQFSSASSAFKFAEWEFESEEEVANESHETQLRESKSTTTPKRLPFRVDPDAATKSFHAFFQDQPLAPSEFRRLGAVNVKPVRSFVPFWMCRFDSTVEVTAKVAPGPSTGENATINYQTVTESHTRSYKQHDPNMQLYGGDVSALPLKEINAAKIDIVDDISEVWEDVALDAEMPKFSTNRKETSEDIARWVYHTEMVKVREILEQKYNTKNIKDIKLHMKSDFDIRAVYIPVYMMVFGYWGNTFRTVVNGVTGQVVGPKILSPMRIIGSTLSAVGIYSMVTVPMGVGFMSHLTSQLANATVYVAPLAMMFAYIKMVRQLGGHSVDRETVYRRMWARERVNKTRTHYDDWRRIQSDKEREWRSWYHEQVLHEHRAHQEQAERARRHRVYSEKFGHQEPRYTPSRPLYQILGLKQGAKHEEIQKGFRTLAKKWHPDKFAGGSDSEMREAARRFQDIMRAYETLRDPKKRVEYDRTGRGGE
eukprot:841875_1